MQVGCEEYRVVTIGEAAVGKTTLRIYDQGRKIVH
jgi:GTPase SAR1 family protein